MAETGNAATGGVLVAPGGPGATPGRTDGGGQKTTGGSAGPSTVGNKEKPDRGQLTYHGSPETLPDGTTVQRATNAHGNSIREERMTDGRVHTTETTPAGEIVSESWVDPTTKTSRTVDTHSDTSSTTTRTFSDGHKEVTDSSREGEHTQVYDKSGKNVVRTVSTEPDGRTTATDRSGQRTDWGGKPAPRPPAGGGMSQVDMGDMEPSPVEGSTRPNPNEQSI